MIDPGDGGAYAPVIDPSAFVDQIDNPYFPLLPGTKWEYESVGAEQPEHTTVVVTNFRRRVMGVSTVVVTRDWNPLEPDVVEEKSYAPGIGLVSEDTVAGRHGAAELVSFTPGRTT